MFNNSTSKTKNVDESNSHNRIGSGTIINGDIETTGDFRVEGQLKGNIKVKGRLVLGPTGSIEGDIECQNAVIEGTLKATMRVIELISMKATAKFDGELVCGKIAIESGAILNAQCKMNNGIIKEINLGERSAKQKQAV